MNRDKRKTNIVKQKLEWFNEEIKDIHSLLDEFSEAVNKDVAKVIQNQDGTREELRMVNLKMDQVGDALMEKSKIFEGELNKILDSFKLSDDAKKLPSETEDFKDLSISSVNQVMLDRLDHLEKAVSLLLEGQQNFENLITKKQSDFVIKKFNKVLKKLDSRCQEQDLKMKHQISNVEELLQSADKKIDENKENLDSQLHDFIKKNNLSRLISLQCLKKLNQVIPVIDEKKNETSRKLHLLMNEMNSVQRQVTDLENRCLFPVGFTAYIKDAITPKMHTLLNGFDNIKYNLSGSFDPSTGIFTAPTDGMYVVSLTIGQAGEGAIGARIDQVLKYPGVLSGDEKSIMIGKVGTKVSNTSSCMVCVVHMRTGDTVCITTVHVSGAAKCNALSCFSCFLV